MYGEVDGIGEKYVVAYFKVMYNEIPPSQRPIS
jgi:hypothetical protein